MDRHVLVRRRAGHLLLNWLVFACCYPLANLLAERGQVTRSLATGLDAAIPFLPWMALPYASAGLLFSFVFFAVRSDEALRVASRRLLLATVAGCLLFAVLPARFGMVRPADVGGLPGLVFAWLDLVDRPYNQFPSLHVAYCAIVWGALRTVYRGALRRLLCAWLVLVAASTLFTWQHHLADVGGGLLLGGACAWAVRPGATRRHAVTFYYTIAAGVLALVGVAALHSWIAAWAVAGMLLVALAYRRRHAGFLSKHAGRHRWHAWLLFWPYLAGYRLTWMLVRLCERHRAPFSQPLPGVWMGRRLTAREAAGLPPGCHVIDLCGELPEVAPLLHARYRQFPLLDLQAPRPSQLRPVLALLARLQDDGHPVYVHCAMGYSRSRLIVRLHQRRNRRCLSRSTS